jgi:hypothetical protein
MTAYQYQSVYIYPDSIAADWDLSRKRKRIQAMLKLDDDVLLYLLATLFEYVTADDFNRFCSMSKYIRQLSERPQTIFLVLQKRYGRENVVAGLLRHPRLIENEKFLSVLLQSTTTTSRPTCRIYIEEALARFSHLPHATAFLCALITNARSVYGSLSLSNSWSVLAQLHGACDGSPRDQCRIRHILWENNVPMSLLFSLDEVVITGTVRRGVIVAMPENLRFGHVLAHLPSLLCAPEEQLIAALEQLLVRTTGRERDRCNVDLGRMAAAVWDAQVLLGIWRIFPGVVAYMPERAVGAARMQLFHLLANRPGGGRYIRDALRAGLVILDDFSAVCFCDKSVRGAGWGAYAMQDKVDVLKVLVEMGKVFNGWERTRVLTFLMRGNFGHLEPLLAALESRALSWDLPLVVVTRLLRSYPQDFPYPISDPHSVVCDVRRALMLARPPHKFSKARAVCNEQLMSSAFRHVPEAQRFLGLSFTLL